MPQASSLSPRFLFILLGALAGLTPLAVDMYLPAIPAIARDLATSIDGAQLTISAFLGGFAIGQLFYGPLADSFGRKPVILAGLTMFAVASVGCAMANSLPELLAWRMLQAAGGAAGSVVVNALLRDLFEKDAFSRAMSFVILVMTLAPLVAPVVGGYISAHADWRVIFWLLVGISLLICVVMQWKIEETLKPEHKQPLRLGQVLGNYWGVLSHRGAMGYVLCGALSSSGMFAFLSASPYVYIEYFKVPTEHYGWLFGLNILLMMVVTFVNSRLVKGVGAERMLQYGLTVLPLAGALLIYNAWSQTGGLWGIVIPVVLFVGHISLVGANAMTGLMGHFPQSAGTASALAGTLRFGIGALVGVLVNLNPPESPLPMAVAIAGCGLGSVAMGKGGNQILAGTTNGTSGNQTFAITFGTLNCIDSESEQVASRVDRFVTANKVALAGDIARGEGETLASLSVMLNCSEGAALGSALQGRFSQIFPSYDVTPMASAWSGSSGWTG